MKRIMMIALCLAMLLAMTVPASADGSVHLSVSASSNSAYRGDSITFYISASGGGSCESFGLLLSYDTSVFEYVGGSSSVADAAISNMSSNGLVASYSGTGVPSGEVGSFTLRVRSGAPVGTFSVSGTASVSGAGASASGTSVTVVCNHSYGAWNKYSADDHQKVCELCGGTQEEGHGWNEGVVNVSPSCKEEGSKTYTCTVCGELKNETLSKTEDHKHGSVVKVDDTNHKAVCSVCSLEQVLPHNWNNGTVTKQETCKETGTKFYTCNDCGATREEVIPLSEVHKYSAWTKVDDNQHYHKCSVCDKEETVDHTWNGGSVTKKPNCIETGTTIYTCTGCGHTKTEEMPVTGVHTYDHGCDKNCNVCDEARSTSHSYSSTWSKNATEHWKSCASCGEKSNVAAHVPGPEATEESAQLCTVCNYVLKPELTHEHKYAEVFTTDAEGHWYPCAGCEEQKAYALHDFDNACDGLCETCGYTRETNHDISEAWSADPVNHYQICLACGHEEEKLPHSPGPEATEFVPQTCETCGYELMPALGHSFAKEWSSDALSHFHSCKCGEKADVADHTWDEGVRESGGKLYTCTVCEAENFEPRNLTWLVIVSGCVAVAGAAAVVILLKKRESK